MKHDSMCGRIRQYVEEEELGNKLDIYLNKNGNVGERMRRQIDAQKNIWG